MQPLPPPSRSSLSSQIKELASQEDGGDTSKSSGDSDDFSSDEEMEEVYNKLEELQGQIDDHREELNKVYEVFNKHEETMEENKQKASDDVIAQKESVLKEIGNHDAVVMQKINFCKDMVDGNKIAIDHQSERLVKSIKRLDNTIKETFQTANNNMLDKVMPLRRYIQMVAEVMRMSSILDMQDERDREFLSLIGVREKTVDPDDEDDYINEQAYPFARLDPVCLTCANPPGEKKLLYE